MPFATPVSLAAPSVVAFDSSVTTGTLSPTGNALVIACGVGTNGNLRQITSTFGVVTDGQGNGWHPLNNDNSDSFTTSSIANTGFGTDVGRAQIYWAITTASPGTGTVTMSAALGVLVLKLHVLEITSGFDPEDPLVQFAFTGASSGTSVTGNLAYAPVAGSMLISVGFGREQNTTVAPDTGWTELVEDVTSDSPFNVQYRTGTTSTQFGIGFGADCTDGVGIGCIELREPTGGVKAPTVLRDFQKTEGSSTHVHPSTGDVTVTAGAWLFCGIILRADAAETITGITDTFDLQVEWTLAKRSASVGSDDHRVEWWYARAADSGDLTGAITVTASTTVQSLGCTLFEIDDSNIDSTNPIGTTGEASTSSLTGGTELNGTFDTTPADTSRLMAMGQAGDIGSQLHVIARQGWTYVGPPINEGAAQTNYPIHKIGAGNKTFGGTFGDTPTSHDQTTGAVWAAIEIQLAATTGTSQLINSGLVNGGLVRA